MKVGQILDVFCQLLQHCAIAIELATRWQVLKVSVCVTASCVKIDRLSCRLVKSSRQVRPENVPVTAHVAAPLLFTKIVAAIVYCQ